MKSEILKPDLSWYEALIKDIQKLEYQGVVITKKAIGDRIVKDEKKFSKPRYGSKRIENIAKDLKISTTEIYNCIQLSKKWPELSDIVGKLKPSWHYVVHNLLVEKTRDKSKTPPLPENLFSLFYIDPPWEYDFSQSTTRKVEQQYDTMPLREIIKIPIESISAEDSVLYLWATSPKLEDALWLINGWGFQYVSSIVWIKDKIGMGYYARSRHELLLIAKRGNLPVPEPKNRPDSVVEAKRGRHSEKPEKIYRMLEKMYPHMNKNNRIEMFARQKRKGWSAWGFEV